MTELNQTECTLTDEELIARIDKWNGKLCRSGGRAWCLKIPPDPNNDPDLLIAELCKRYEKTIKSKPL